MEDKQLRSATLCYTLSLCRAIAACRQLERVLSLLTQGVSALLDYPQLETSSTDATDEELGACRRSLAAAAAAATGYSQCSHGQMVQHAFYSSTAFQEASQALLTGIAGVVPAQSKASKHGAA